MLHNFYLFLLIFLEGKMPGGAQGLFLSLYFEIISAGVQGTRWDMGDSTQAGHMQSCIILFQSQSLTTLKNKVPTCWMKSIANAKKSTNHFGEQNC